MNKKLYLLWMHSWDSWDLAGVFSSKEKVYNLIKKWNEENFIKEYPDDYTPYIEGYDFIIKKAILNKAIEIKEDF